jgi:hypothetical protein
MRCVFAFRYDKPGKSVPSEKTSNIIITFSPGVSPRLHHANENPVRAFRPADSSGRFGRSDLALWTVGGQTLCVCQKPVDLMR